MGGNVGTMLQSCTALVTLLLASAWADNTAVTSLPDLTGGPVSGMYAGYLNVSGRHYYYVFARAQSNAEQAPFLFWTNGGAGCSSVGEGLWMEHGPYQVSNDQIGVKPNPFSWNRFANVLYLEHPVGVGFSYSDNASDYDDLNDFKEATDLYLSLQLFVRKFPQFAPKAHTGLWLTGESYGGEYVTHLAHQIVFGADPVLKQALRGLAIGNPELNCEIVQSGQSITLQYQLYYHHGLMSFTQFNSWALSNCSQHPLSKACQILFAQAEKAIGTVNQQLLKTKGRRANNFMSSAQLTEANFDPDHKYQSFCLGNSTLRFADQANSDSESCHPLGDPGRMSTYLNRKDVQKALHTRPDKMLSTPWTDCAGDSINYTSSDVNQLRAYLEPIFSVTTEESFRVLIFSGDEDIATCPGPITQACLSELRGTNLKRAWQPWSVNGITAGYFEEYDRYTFATVKGAGHTVPQYQPKTTFELVTRWFANVSLSS